MGIGIETAAMVVGEAVEAMGEAVEDAVGKTDVAASDELRAAVTVPLLAVEVSLGSFNGGALTLETMAVVVVSGAGAGAGARIAISPYNSS
jgi:hypothetical protein